MIKSKKQMFIVIGAFLLTILLGTVTYAFFNYTRTGTANTIKTGRISFNSEQGTAINLTNMFPIDVTNGIPDDVTKVGTVTIHVTGDTTYAEGVEYLVSAVNVTNTVGSKSLPISIDVAVTSNTNNNPVTTLGTSDDNYFTNRGTSASTSIYKVLANDTISTNDQLVVGYIKSGATGIDGNIVIKAYLDKSKIAITDTYDGNETDNMGTTTEWVDGRVTFTTTEWNSLQQDGISFQVKVESNEGIWVEEPLTGTKMVQRAILAKQNAETNSCNPIWTDSEDGIVYFSGTNECVDMNYVWYSGKLWRITAIYPDGAMKLVTENNITLIAYNKSSVNFYTDANTTSYMYQWLNEDFYDTLYNPSQFIDTTKRWNATMPENTTISTKPQETNMVTANVGLLNNYEFYNSYRCIDSSTCTGSSYNTGYLNIVYLWWLLNPYNASRGWLVDVNGRGISNGSTNSYGVRPSIYLKSGVEFTGEGTESSPYKIVGDKDTGAANELIYTRMSGEYVKLQNGNNEQLFRIIGVEDNKTKIIAMDYADNKAAKKFAVGNTSGDGTIYGTGQTATQGEDIWYNYLTGTYEQNLETTYGPLFDSGLYYLGTIGYNYKLSVCANTTSGNTKICDKTSDKGTFNIGLSRYGEMFATQQSGGYSNSINMWLMNRYSASFVWYVDSSGYGSGNFPTGTSGVRPTVHLKSSIKIISGTGTETDPYVVGL